MVRCTPLGNLSLMTFGHGQPPSGWPPPSDPGSRPPGRRRAPADEGEPFSGYEDRTFQAPPAPPVADAPDRPRTSRPDRSPAPPPPPHDIGNRQVDPGPLTEAELSPAPAGYQVIKTQALPDCKTVAVGEPVKVLAMAGCTQVVRATVLSADKGYVATVGLLNLDSQTGAQQANEAIRTAVGTQKGRFTGYAAGGPSDVFGKAATQLGWDVRGHFLGYCVVARADGTALDNDAHARQIIDDLVEKYVIGTVLQRRV